MLRSKRLWVAAIGTVTLLALAGAGQASAVGTVCSAHPTLFTATCKANTALHAIAAQGSGNEAVLFNAGEIEIICESSEYTAEMETVKGAIEGIVNEVSASECSDNVPFCNIQDPIMATEIPVTVSWVSEGAPEATATVVNPTITLVFEGTFCFGGPYKCTYGNATTVVGDAYNPVLNEEEEEVTTQSELRFGGELLNASAENDEICPGAGEITHTFSQQADEQIRQSDQSSIGAGQYWYALFQ